jgi:hypothetical protein
VEFINKFILLSRFAKKVNKFVASLSYLVRVIIFVSKLNILGKQDTASLVVHDVHLQIEEPNFKANHTA